MLKKKRNSSIKGELIKKAREKLGLTQRKAGDKIGITDQTLSNIEMNTNEPKASLFMKICKTLNIDPWELVNE